MSIQIAPCPRCGYKVEGLDFHLTCHDYMDRHLCPHLERHHLDYVYIPCQDCDARGEMALDMLYVQSVCRELVKELGTHIRAVNNHTRLVEQLIQARALIRNAANRQLTLTSENFTVQTVLANCDAALNAVEEGGE